MSEMVSTENKKTKAISIGNQDFSSIITKNHFYIDKTSFLKEWWEDGATVTLITRPRRFGKTLTMNMTERFFSNFYAQDGSVFEGLSIWEEETYRNLQGTYPVISVSFADVKEITFEGAKNQIYKILMNIFDQYRFLLQEDMRIFFNSTFKKEF